MINSKTKIEFDSNTCIGCKLCYKACFLDVIRWDDATKKPVFKYAEDCEHCFYCQVVCVKKCIKITPDFESERLYQTFDKYR